MADKIGAPIRIFKFNDKFNEKNLTTDDLKEFSEELEIDLKDVELYFRHYTINKRYPIKTLDRFDLDFVELLVQWKYDHRGLRVSLPEFLSQMAKEFGTYGEEYIKNKLQIYMKYEDFLLTPYIVYGNAEPPYHYALTNYEIQVQLSRLALGEFSSRYEKFVPSNVRVRAIELMVRMREGKGGGELIDLDNKADGDQIDLTKLSTRELLEVVKYAEGRGPEVRHAKPTEEEKIPKVTDIVDAEYELPKKGKGRPRTGQFDDPNSVKTTPHKPDSDKRKVKRAEPKKPGPKVEKRGRPRKGVNDDKTNTKA